MTHSDRIEQDLQYVRGALERSRRDLGAAPIYFLWAAIVAVGFPLADFVPRLATPFWIVASLGGGALSVWLGMRDARRRAVPDRARGMREGLHWLAAGVATGVLLLLAGSARLPPTQFGSLLLAVMGLAYVLAGIHLHPPLRWPGVAMLAGAYAMLLLPLPWPWTLTAAVVAASLVVGGVAALREARRHE